MVLCLGLAVATGPRAQTEADDMSSAVFAAQWNRSLDLIEQQLNRVDTTASDARRFLDLTRQIRREAEEVSAALKRDIESATRRLEALGPPPEEGALAEAPEIAEGRATLNEQLQRLNARFTRARLALVRVDELDDLIGSLSQRKRFEALFRPYPLPLMPDTWRQAVPEALAIFQTLADSPVVWWRQVQSSETEEVLPLGLAAVLVLFLGAGGFLRRWLLRRYRRDPSVAEPSYSARFLAAVASALAHGLMPALVFAGLVYLVWASEPLGYSLFLSLVSDFFVVMAFFSLAWGVPYALLSPDLPQWRMLAVSTKNARRLGRRLKLLAIFFAIAIFMSLLHDQIGVSDAYFSISTFILITPLSLTLIDSVRARYWVKEPRGDEEKIEGEEEVDWMSAQGPTRTNIRRACAVIAAASVVASLVGYADFADFLVTNLFLTIVTLVTSYLLRGVGRELIGAFMRSSIMLRSLELRHVVRSRLKFWLRLLLDTILTIVGFLLIAAIWASPFVDFWTEARNVFSGFTIGGVTISVVDLFSAIAIFTLILVMTRLGQRFLSKRVLPQTGFDYGVQNSVTAGLGYVGIVLAAVVGISALGIDLSNIALIAGALSVGIGFGLQAIVSNFVSGIILLIERPIKVGDWVLVGANEGTVKRITVRSTELTTFQRASVIIPNSEFISTSVINWTHKDTYGRIEVPVGVAYGSDVEKVREVLLDCAQKQEMVLTSPEPQVLFMNFGDSSLDFELRCFTNNVSYRMMISSNLRFAIDRGFREAGIEIPFPQRVVHMADRADPGPPVAAEDAEPAPPRDPTPPQE